MNKILITGGAGFIGSHTADALLAKGLKVRVLDSLAAQIHGGCSRPDYLHPQVELVVGDIRSRRDVARAIAGVDAIFHFAALTGVGQSMYDIHSYVDVNINGTALLLDLLANSEHQVQKLILSSSRAVYGEGAYLCRGCGPVFPPPRKREKLEKGEWEMSCPKCAEMVSPLPTDEMKPAEPVSVYALTKKVQEELFRMFGQTYCLPYVILRYFNVYGHRQAINNPYTGIGSIFTNRALAGQDVPLYEDGASGRDFVNVRDVVQANLLALERSDADNGTYNVGSGELLTVRELAETVLTTLGIRQSTSLTGQYRIGDIRHCYADLKLSRSLLGYRPSVPLREGIAELVDWARGERVEDHHVEAEAALRQRKLM